MNGPEGGRRMPRLEAGRRPAGMALLGWLDDPRAPRLCRVSGAPSAGKSHLIAWLVQACSMETTPSGQRIHAVLPAGGVGVRSAVWLFGQQLHVVAHSPDDLVAALARDERPTVICVPDLDQAVEPARLVSDLLDRLLELEHVRLLVEASSGGPAAAAFTVVTEPAVLDLDDPQWTDRERFAAWCTGVGADAEAYPLPGRALGRPVKSAAEEPSALLARVPAGPGGTPDLRAAGEELLSALWESAARDGELGPLAGDPVLYALARPETVTAALDGRESPMPQAWQAAGPALVDEADPAVRAAVLRTRLLGVDDRAAVALDAVAGDGWAARWAHWEASGHDGQWPGPTIELAAGSGPYANQILAADPSGLVRTFDAATGRRVGTVVTPGPKPLRGLAVTTGGCVVLLDSWGGTELVVPTDGWPGLEPHDLTDAIEAVREAASGELTVVTAIGRLPTAAPAFGDATGEVYWVEPDEVISAPLHRGPVTALAGVALGGGGLSEPDLPLLLSGGLDGTVRLWGPASDPLLDPVDRRGCPVTAVAAGVTAAGPLAAAAWSDGLIRIRDLGGRNETQEIRLGSEIWSLVLTGTLLIAGAPDGLVAIDLRPRPLRTR